MDFSEGIAKLRDFTSAVHPLQPGEWQAFSEIWQPFATKRKVLLTASGETEKHLYFVLEGVQRAFYMGEDEKEATLVFTYPYSFSGVADSFLLQTPSRYYFETLTASSFLRTSHRQVDELMNRFHNFERLIRKATSHALAGVLERQIELQYFSAEQKFRVLLKRSPQVLHLIPHKYLASYLGIDATTFSKLLSTVRL